MLYNHHLQQFIIMFIVFNYELARKKQAKVFLALTLGLNKAKQQGFGLI
jgi:hypothetical protein